MFKKNPAKVKQKPPQVTLNQLQEEHEIFSKKFTDLWEEWAADSKRLQASGSKVAYSFFQESGKQLLEHLDSFLGDMKRLNLDPDAQRYIDTFKPYQQLLHFKETVYMHIKKVLPESKSALSDLEDIGPQKPLGYLPIKFIKEVLPDDVARDMFYKKLLSSGLVQKNIADCVYFYDEKALNQLLLEKKDVLKGSKLDVLNGDEFIQRMEQHSAPPYTASYDVVADAFGNYAGPGREKLNLAKLFPLLSYEPPVKDENQELTSPGYSAPKPK